MESQRIIAAGNDYAELDMLFDSLEIKKIFLVCGNSISKLRIGAYFDELFERKGIKVVRFSQFTPNPVYESVVAGVNLFNQEKCQLIVAVGGGSSMDVAKCIKLYSNMDPSEHYLKQTIVPNDIPLMAVPTTAGTGSEATRFAVIYDNGEKQSVSDDSAIPSIVVFDASALKTLPDDQRKVTMLDALCHALESFWSVNSTDESREYSRQAIKMILENKNAYLANDEAGNIAMLKAANIAGKAINIAQTTAGHAMCYKLTSLYGIAHGHAAALCVSKLFPYMAANTEKCIDPRGEGFLKEIFSEIAFAMGTDSVNNSVKRFQELLDDLRLGVPSPGTGDYELLRDSVNPVRLKNNPVELSAEAIDMLYHQILSTVSKV